MSLVYVTPNEMFERRIMSKGYNFVFKDINVSQIFNEKFIYIYMAIFHYCCDFLFKTERKPFLRLWNSMMTEDIWLLK